MAIYNVYCQNSNAGSLFVLMLIDSHHVRGDGNVPAGHVRVEGRRRRRKIRRSRHRQRHRLKLCQCIPRPRSALAHRRHLPHRQREQAVNIPH